MDMEFWRGEDSVVASGCEEDLNVLRPKFLVATHRYPKKCDPSLRVIHRYGAGAAPPTIPQHDQQREYCDIIVFSHSSQTRLWLKLWYKASASQTTCVI
jgi:hypothetical protein